LIEASTLEGELDDSVLQHMRTDFTPLRLGQTAGQALASVRESPPGGRIIYFYVTDEDNRLVGVVPTRRMLLSPPDRPVAEIMVRQIVAIPQSATVLDACAFFTSYRLLAFPIVDDERRLLGYVDVELYTHELNDIDRREGNEELFQLIGVHQSIHDRPTPLRSFRARFPWLIANIAGGILCAMLSGLFSAELEKAVALALFIPVVLALAESVSIQSVSLSLQSMRRRAPTIGSILKRLRTEAFTGILLGIASGAAVALVAAAWLGDWRVAACLLGGIAGSVTCAASIGISMPGLIRLFAREPQVAAGPIALAAADLTTLLIYFSLARWLIA
jgi:magnesium transporter